MELAIDQLVVYAGHGVGRIVSRTRRTVGGARREVIGIEFAGGLAVSLPIELAVSQLRPLATEAELQPVGSTLRQSRSGDDRRWLTRKNETLARLKDGSALDLAQVIRDTAPTSDTARRSQSDAQTGERGAFLRARELLSDEIAHIRGLEPQQARDWIDAQLAARD